MNRDNLIYKLKTKMKTLIGNFLLIALAGLAQPATLYAQEAEKPTKAKTLYPSAWTDWKPYESPVERDSVVWRWTPKALRALGIVPPARWLSIDPLADEYPAWSPYNYVAGNPVRYIDPNGREIWIYYQDEDGNEQKLQYAAGLEYEGSNQFVQTTITALNQIASLENGMTVLNSLISSSNTFALTNATTSVTSGTANVFSFTARSRGGGTLQLGGITEVSGSQQIEPFAHELFHAFQTENGQRGGRTVNNEVGAYLYGQSIALSLGYPVGALARLDGSAATQTYDRATRALLYDNVFDKSQYARAVNTFKAGSQANVNGIYNGFQVVDIRTVNSRTINPLIANFYPLLR